MSSPAVTLAVAGVVIRIELPAAAWVDVLAASYAAFLTAAEPRWFVRVLHDDTHGSSELGWARHDGPLTAFHVYAYRGEIDLGAHTAQVTAPALERLPSAVERVLTYILMQTLPREHDALLLHACGVAFRGRGYAFFGPSGAGKTTIGTLAQGHAEVLCDENVVLRLAGPGVELISTPLWGTSTPPKLIHRVDRALPLAGLFSLVHAPGFSLQPLTPGQGIAALLDTEKVATERVESAEAWLDVAGRIVQRLPVRRLAFPPTPELWSFISRQEVDAAD